MEKLKTIDKKTWGRKSDFIHSIMLILSYMISVASGVFESKLLAALAGLLITWTVVIAHNYFHQKDNWRMYTFNLSFMNFRDWRVSHAMSHHMFPNSYHDLELSMFEPFLCWIPNPFIKNHVLRYISCIYSPLLYSLCTIMQYFHRTVYSLTSGKNVLELNDLIPFTIPLAMFLLNSSCVFKVLQLWLIIILVSGFSTGLIGINAAHHHPEIIHEGDKMRDNRDWGLYQIDTIIDRQDLKGLPLLAITHFGDHSLHHLFPTLDHGVLPLLYPTLYETLDEFEGEVRECNWLHHIIGQFRQLVRIQPNPNPPSK